MAALVFVGVLCQSVSAGSLEALQGYSETGQQAAAAGDIYSARDLSSRGFDGGTPLVAASSPPLVPKPVKGSRLQPRPDVIVGKEGTRIREPRNPFTRDGKPKDRRSGKWYWWGLGGAAAGAGIGFLVGGPAGALIGGILGALLGLFFGP